MYQFSKISQARLDTCHDDLKIIFNWVIHFYDCSVVSGHRGKEEQDDAYENGYSQLRWPMSKHNTYPSMAVDVAPYEKTGIDWSKLQSAHFAGYVKAIADFLYINGLIEHKLRSGADWDNDNDVDDTKFWDAAHFELITNEND